MAYQAELSRSNRSCILFLIDRSRSMVDPFGESSQRLKKDGVADAVNKLLHTLVSRCATAEEVRDIYDIGVIGYGMDTGPAFGGNLVHARCRRTADDAATIEPGFSPTEVVQKHADDVGLLGSLHKRRSENQ